MNEKIAEFVKVADEVSAEYWQKQKFTHAPAPKHRADYISDKWVRIVTTELRNNTWQDSSVYAFIALVDNETKTLGMVKAGDIHKAATFKAPAKHARGSIFTDFRKALTPFGPNYLR